MIPDKITPPGPDEYTANYAGYIQRINGIDLVAALEAGKDNLINFIQTIPDNKLDYRYQPGKWTIRELLIHLIDCERIFLYRALCFSRNDKTLLPGFDENEYVPNSNAPERNRESTIAEYTAVRRSAIELYKYMTAEMSQRTGIACGRQISVRALGYAIAGHELHHIDIVKERYL